MPNGRPSSPRVTTSSVSGSSARVSLIEMPEPAAASANRPPIVSLLRMAVRARSRLRDPCRSAVKYGAL